MKKIIDQYQYLNLMSEILIHNKLNDEELELFNHYLSS